MAVEDQGNYTLKYLYKLCEGISLIKGGIKVLCDLNYPSSIIETTCKILKTI
jgi:DNA mismatch repair ATPase MutS